MIENLIDNMFIVLHPSVLIWFVISNRLVFILSSTDKHGNSDVGFKHKVVRIKIDVFFALCIEDSGFPCISCQPKINLSMFYSIKSWTRLYCGVGYISLDFAFTRDRLIWWLRKQRIHNRE